jgi:hypothetical protein
MSRVLCWTLAVVLPLAAAPLDAQDAFRRGDASRDGRVDLDDVVRIVNIAAGAAASVCPDAADVNDDGVVLVSDAVALANYLYAPGAAPAAPFPACGLDPTLDVLVACVYPASSCVEQPRRAESPNFELRLEGGTKAAAGIPGTVVQLGTFTAGLCNGDGGAEDEGFLVQAWSLSITASGCSITAATTQGTAGAESAIDPAGHRSGGFEKTDLTSGAAGRGVVSAVVLSFALPVRLPERAVGPDCEPHPLLKLDVEAVAPAAGTTRDCVLSFADGLQGGGQPVPNLATTSAGAFLPAQKPRTVSLRGSLLRASIAAPRRVLLLGSTVIVPFDGTASLDELGGRALLYDWRVIAAPSAPVIARPRDASTPITFSAAGAYVVELTVLGGDQFDLAAVSTAALSVVRVEDAELAAPLFAGPLPSLPTGLTGRTFQASFPLAAGNPRAAFSLTGTVPLGAAVNAEGVLRWHPSREQSGSHAFTLRAANTRGEARLDVVLEVADEAAPVASFRAGEPAAQAKAAAGDGGGASLREAPAALADGSGVDPELDFHLQIASGSGSESVLEVVPDQPPGGGDRFAAIRFAPDPAQRPGGDGPFGGRYRSGASASKLTEQVLAGGQDFTVEVWVSRMPERQAGADADSPAVLLALMARESGRASWLLGKRDPGAFVARVETSAGPVGISLEVDLDDGAPHQLVLVKSGSLHALYLDGARAASRSQTAKLDWDVDDELFLGGDSAQLHPVAADVHLVSLHAEALSEAHIRHLFELGLDDPPQPQPPAVAICPDPHVIGRGAAAIAAEAEPFAGGDGQAAGIEPLCFDGDLRRTVWTWHAKGAEARDDIVLEPASSATPCQRVVHLFYDPSRPPLDVTLDVTIEQVPVRGQVRSATATFEVSLPLVRLFRRGDANGSGDMDISDAIYVLGYLFLGDETPSCFDAADSNDDGEVFMNDAIIILNRLFSGRLCPAAPGPLDCGEDPTGASGADALDCAEYPDPRSPAAACPRP